MPTLVSKAELTNATITGSNNFLSVIATTNAYQITGTTSTAVSTTPVTHTAFLGAGETVTAIGLELTGVAVLTGVTLTLRVRNTTDGVNTDYTFNAETSLSTGGRGWYFFSLGPTGQVFTLNKSWQVQVFSNTASRISLARTATAGDWNRLFVTNAETTFATGDILFISGRVTTSTLLSTSYLVNSSISLASLFINNYSELNWTANNLTMTVSGNLVIFSGGSFIVGGAGPVAGLIEFSNTTAGEDAFSAYGPCTFIIEGSDISSNYNINLASTANASQAAAVLASAPDWTAGRTVVYTTSRGTGGEVRTISTVSGTTVTNTTNFAVIHDVRTVGTYTTINDTAIACLMDRGFVVGNTSAATGTWYGSVYGPATCSWTNVYFRDYGANAITSGLIPSKYGWVIDITEGGLFSAINCSFYTSAQTNTSCILSENSTTRKSTGYSIDSCLFVSRTSASVSLIINGADNAYHTFSNCIAINATIASTNSCYLTRSSNSGNVSITDFKTFGYYNLIQRNEATTGNLGAITVENCFHCGYGFYTSTNAATSGSFSVGNVSISNCTALNRVSNLGTAAVRLDTINQPLITLQLCKFLGYSRYFYGTETVSRTVLFDQCHFEDDSVASQTPILIGATQRPYVAFKSCFFYTTFANQSFILANWSNYPVYSNKAGGRLMFQSCSFNGDGSLFLTLVTSKYFYGYTATLENCLFRDSGATISGQFVKMGKVLNSTDTFSGTGTSVAITPTSNNDGDFPFRYQFALPTITTGALTVNFKTKSYSLNGSVAAYIENDFGVLTQSFLTVSSSWNSQSLSTTLSSTCKEALYLTLELYGNTGYLVVDEITTTNAEGPLGIDGVTMFLPPEGGGETSNLFC
jgi:hypothetical protein